MRLVSLLGVVAVDLLRAAAHEASRCWRERRNVAICQSFTAARALVPRRRALGLA